MSSSPNHQGHAPAVAMEHKKSSKLGLLSGVYIPVCLNIMSILMFLRFGLILGQIGFMGIFGLLVTAYCIDLLTTLSLSAIASNGEVKGGGAYYLISRSLGPEFGGSIGILFFLAQALNTAMNIVGLIDCIRLNLGAEFAEGYWAGYGLQTAALMLCTGMCLLGSAIFSKASNLLLAILTVAVVSIPISAILKAPFRDEQAGIVYTGPSLNTLASNFLPHSNVKEYKGLETFRDLFGILFPATSGIFAGASMSGDLKSPSKSIPKGTLWAMLTTFIVYFIVALSMACTIARKSLLANINIISLTNLSAPVILAGECAVTVFSALMGIIGSAKLFQALAKDRLLPGLSVFGRGTKRNDEPTFAILLTYSIAQLALLADLNQIATFISMGFQMTFFVMNLACFLLKVGSAPNFRPSFKFFSWQTACMGSILSAAAMVFIDETYAAMAVCGLVFVFLLIHYLCPPKRWGDVSQNLIYHQVRKYLLRLKPEHIKFWRPHIILLVNDPRRQTRLIQFCNSLKKGSLYILGHVIVTDDFSSGVHEAKLQQQAWTRYISEFSRIKAFVELNMSPSIVWGVRNLVLSAGLGGMRPNIAIMGFFNMDDLRRSNPVIQVPEIPASPATKMNRRPKPVGKATRRHRRDTSARLLESVLPTDAIRTESMMSPTDYMIMLEDLALRYRLNVAVAYGFEQLETPRKDASNSKQYVDLWPIQMSAEVSSDGNHVLTTNFDTYTLILQLGHILQSVQAWQEAYVLRVMVFVEYEDEVEEERARLRALLDKLRIEAEVWVFYLASGQLNTYELIINDNCRDIDTEIIVSDALKEEDWWEDLRMFRRHLEEQEFYHTEESSRFAHFLDSTCGRVGAYNPHEQPGHDRRRQSVAEVMDIPRQPDIATLSKLGVNMGIHTTHIDDTVLQDSAADSDYETALDDVIEDELEDSFYSDTSGAEDPEQHPLLQPRSTHNKAARPTLQSVYGSQLEMREPVSSIPTSYGTESTIETMKGKQERRPAILLLPQATDILTSPSEVTADRDKSMQTETSHLLIDPIMVPEFPSGSSHRSRSRSPNRAGRRAPRDGNMTPARPNLSRQSSAARFSSRPVPETTITMEGEGSKISFAPSVSNPATPRTERPGMSRQSSLAKAVSRALPDTNIGLSEEGGSAVNIANKPLPQNTRLPRPGPHPGLHSRRPNHPSLGLVSPEIPEHVETFRAIDPADVIGPETSTTISGPDLSLSFNDLPSRAQHLILNELMRKQSNNTAVLMTTLPIPSEETSLDEHSTIQYLSNVELLCNELPPTLLVLSNNVTVTVNL